MTELKPCPFCGREARISYGLDTNLYKTETYVVAMCSSCGIRTPKFFYVSEQGELAEAETMVTKRWNRKVDNGT